MKHLFTSPLFALFLLLFFGLKSSLFAQSIGDEINSVHGNFQIDAQYYEADSLIGAPKVPEKLLSNIFGNINYVKGNFSAGIRYEAYNNVRQGFLPGYRGQGIANRFVQYHTPVLDVTLGNIYEQFGTGLMLRTYYEPGLLYDNSIDGARVISNPYKGLTLKGIIGKQRQFFAVGPGIVRGVDTEIDLNELLDSVLGNKKTRVILGGSFVSKFQTDQSPNLILPENVGTYGGRLSVIREGFNFTGEYAYKINDPSFDNQFSYKFGDALFLSSSYSGEGFSVLLQGKRIDNMSYRSNRDETLQNVLINYLPATTKQHAYTLMALNPYATQLRGEIGFMAEGQYKFEKESLLGGKYGTELTINYSQASGLKQYGVRDSSTNMTYYETKWDFSELSNATDHYDSVLVTGAGGSYYSRKRVSNFAANKYYQDFFIEINKKFSKKVKATFMYSRQFYNRNIIQFGTKNAGLKNLDANIGVIDVSYKYRTGYTIRVEVQGLFTPNRNVETNSNLIAKGNWSTALIEWTLNGKWFVAVFDQYNYGNPDPKLRVHYYLGNVGYTSGPHRVSLSYGKQSAGIFCVGGVCRLVPASNGITLSITSSF
jgi:hypothetical protein